MTGPRRRLIPLGPLLLLAATASCGRKLPPEAPLEVLPARVEPVKLTQEGSDVVLRFPFPSRTTAGRGLEGLSRVTVRRELTAVKPDATVPDPPEGPALSREEKLFRLRSEVVADLPREEVDALTSGSEVVVRDSLYPIFAEKRAGRVQLRYGVTATRDKRKESALSPLVSILPRIPPGAPIGLLATVEDGRVCLEWIPPSVMLDGSQEMVLRAYALYRRDLAEEAYGDPVGVTTLGPFFIDETVKSDRRYVYTVRAAPSDASPLVLGPPSDQILVDTADVFAPAVPEGFEVLAEENGNRLVWNPGATPDLTGYRVYRSLQGRWDLLATGLTDPAYFDAAAPGGSRYAVTAVDRAGNESARSSVQPSPQEQP